MKIETFNTLNLIPIGKVSFKFNKKFPRNTERQYVYIGEVNIMCETDRKISKETYDALMKLMKKAKSDLLTDGRDFYTTRGAVITQIAHGSFHSILEIAKAEGVDINVMLYGN
jgi:hypothetical protein